MRVAIAGGTGMIGSALAQSLTARGDDVLLLTRRAPRNPSEIRWDPVKKTIDLAKLEGLDALVHLAGAPIAARPWTRARRQLLWDSRIDSTAVLLDAISRLSRPPKIFLGTGHLGFYGDRGDEILDESSSPGTGFLAELSKKWEDTQLEAEQLGCRTAILRLSMVLGATGGALPLLVKPFRIGIGGWLGDGEQYISWITLRDTVRAFLYLLDHSDAKGRFNGSVPEPIRNREWTLAIGKAVHRPVLTHAPRWVLRGAFGDLADEFFLASMRVIPQKLLAGGFRFHDPIASEAFVMLLEELDALAI